MTRAGLARQVVLAMLSMAATGRADPIMSFIWRTDVVRGDWQTASNWVDQVVPNWDLNGTIPTHLVSIGAGVDANVFSPPPRNLFASAGTLALGAGSTLTVSNGQVLHVADVLNNYGTVVIGGNNATGDTPLLWYGSTWRDQYTASTTLTGGGSILLTDSQATIGPRPTGWQSSGPLVIENQTIKGIGSINLWTDTGASVGALSRIESYGGTLSVIGGPLNNSGQLATSAGNTLYVGNLANYIDGTHVLAGGTYLVGGTLVLGTENTPYGSMRRAEITVNAATIVLDGPHSFFDSTYFGINNGSALDGLAVNVGSFSVINGRDFTTAGDFDNRGSLLVGAGSAFTVTGGFTNTGSLTVNGQLAAAGIDVAAGQTLTGAGTIVGDLLVYGELNPGQSPGTLAVTGNYTQAAGSTLMIELAGTGADQFDQLIVDGDVYLWGDLVVVLYDGFLPHAGDSFNILRWTGIRTGGFAQMTFPSLGPGYVWSSIWGDQSLTLALRQEGEPGGVPEPGTVYLMLSGALLVAGRLVRRRRGSRR